MNSNGFNYLVPTDATMHREAVVKYDCVRADRALAGLEQSKSVNIMILDACRDNPLIRSWNRGNTQQGLSNMEAPKGSFIAYSIKSGATSPDGEGNNSLYTSQLVKFLTIPNLKLEEVFKQTRIAVMNASNDKQVPNNYSSIIGDFYFVKADDDPNWDGIPNKFDKCPDEYGVIDHDGCPKPISKKMELTSLHYSSILAVLVFVQLI